MTDDNDCITAQDREDWAGDQKWEEYHQSEEYSLHLARSRFRMLWRQAHDFRRIAQGYELRGWNTNSIRNRYWLKEKVKEARECLAQIRRLRELVEAGR